MDNRRLFLFAALIMVGFLIYQAWMQDYGPKTATHVTQTAASHSEAVAAATAEQIPTAPSAATSLGVSSNTAKGAAPVAVPINPGEQVHVRTDLLDVDINTAGGDLRVARLLKYPVQLKKPAVIKVLNDRGQALLIAQSGLQTHSGHQAPTDQTVYTVSQTRYQLAPGAKTLTVALNWKDSNGLAVRKIYTFTRGSYQIGLVYRIHNGSSEPWSGAQYTQFDKHYVEESHGLFSVHRYDYQSVSMYDTHGYHQYDFKELAHKSINQVTPGGWIAVGNRYFLAAAIAQPNVAEATSRQRTGQTAAVENLYYTRSLGDARYLVGTITAVKTAAPGHTTTFRDKFFVGPKLQTRLAQVAPGLELTVDYGKLTIISEPIFKVLNLIHGFIGNWGWSILVLTLLFKLVFYPLNQISGRSMAKMRRVQPRLKALQERYKDDKQRLGQATMEFYKKEKINPMGGCLPMLVQMPIFFALYYVLVYSVELRQSPWLGWIHDLSAPDPYFILPVLYGIVMFIQQRISPQPITDKMQRRIMMAMPFGIAVLYTVLPSGLGLYYVANSILTIVQQWRINRVVGRDDHKHSAAPK